MFDYPRVKVQRARGFSERAKGERGGVGLSLKNEDGGPLTMPQAGFIQHKWQKRHEYLVEQCQAIHISEVLPSLSRLNLQLIQTYLDVPGHTFLRIIPRRGGIFKKWYFACPRCRRPFEALYVTPASRCDDWRCRTCWSLVYASQRYGYRHPLRRTLTYRKKITMRKEILRQNKMRLWKGVSKSKHSRVI